MDTSKTYIVKGMVCNRCITTLHNELSRYDLTINDLSLGKVGITFHSEKFNDATLSKTLSALGFSLGNTKSVKLAERVKQVVKNYFETFDPSETKILFSELISNELNMSYDAVSSVFTSVTGITIESFIITHRINVVKKMLVETEYTLTEIAFRTGFSSVHHLSRQFKDVASVSPSVYRTQHTQLS